MSKRARSSSPPDPLQDPLFADLDEVEDSAAVDQTADAIGGKNPEPLRAHILGKMEAMPKVYLNMQHHLFPVCIGMDVANRFSWFIFFASCSNINPV